ncbi:hypothetical protein NDU88_004212 [Pleurodeles waltl]|uniref:Uncharacterized protein n=1 Tax=Pleurodeles waltl TaxID=8319 RepID=A0AAV7RF40_PLEWA|nr:hypothetical protein NDU88_004212 [Pleurodeles waltl]
MVRRTASASAEALLARTRSEPVPQLFSASNQKPKRPDESDVSQFANLRPKVSRVSTMCGVTPGARSTLRASRATRVAEEKGVGQAVRAGREKRSCHVVPCPLAGKTYRTQAPLSATS